MSYTQDLLWTLQFRTQDLGGYGWWKIRQKSTLERQESRCGAFRSRPATRYGKDAGQVACKPGSVLALQRWMAIPLGRPLPNASRDRPGRRRGNTAAGYPACRPYLVLLPVGFTMPLPLPVARWALTPPFHPCLLVAAQRRASAAVCFLWHFPWGRPRRSLTGTVSPWSPDFPHPPGRPGKRSHPAA